MLMFDRITKIDNKSGEFKKGMIEALRKNQKNIIGFNKFSDFEINFNKSCDIDGFKPFNLKMFI